MKGISIDVKVILKGECEKKTFLSPVVRTIGHVGKYKSRMGL